jgi:putative DNA primase/helicase
MNQYADLPLAGAVRMSQVQRSAVRWLWEARLPFGKVSVIDGDPGLGKSTIVLDLIARVTTGTPFPDSTQSLEPLSVVILSAEDDASDTIRPRLEVAGANLERVTHLQTIALKGGKVRGPELPADIELIGRLIQEEEAAWVVIDPLMAFLSGSVDSSRDQDVRRVLYELKELAETTGAALTFLRHLNKSGGASPLYRGGGSIGIIGAARAGLLVAPDPEDEDRRIVAVSKNNLAAHPPALAYRLVPHGVLDVAQVKWEGPTEHKASQLLAEPQSDDDKGALADAKEFLRDALSRGAVASKRVQRDAKDAGVSERTLRRAKKDLGVVARKIGAPEDDHQQWVWELPEGGQETPKVAKAAIPEGGQPSNLSSSKPWPSWQPSGNVGRLRNGHEPVVSAVTEGWQYGGEMGECTVCGRNCTTRDPSGVVMHPACSQERATA